MVADLFKELFNRLKLGGIDIDNWNFKLFSKVSVGIFFLASAFSIASSYSGGAITCLGLESSSYQSTYCWLHGAYHLPTKILDKVVAHGERCIRPTGENVSSAESDQPDSAYYIWVSVVLFMNGALFLVPDQIWKYFESGMIDQFDCSKNKSNKNAPEDAKTFIDLSKNNTKRYFFIFIGCECLNFFIAIASFVMTDKFLDGNFKTYGRDALAYYSGGNPKEVTYTDQFGDIQKASVDPTCLAFPTVVSCKTYSGGAGGTTVDKGSHLCILGQNIVNQKIYVVLWFWFMVLFTTSLGMFCYRVVTFSHSSFRYMTLHSLNRTKNVNVVKAVPVDFANIGHWFVLNQIGRNTNPYYFREFLKQVVEKERTCLLSEEDGPNLFNGEKGASVAIEMKENNDFPPANKS